VGEGSGGRDGLVRPLGVVTGVAKGWGERNRGLETVGMVDEMKWFWNSFLHGS
jgi:hypothetical protein